MNRVIFLHDRFTADDLLLPMVHFDSGKRDVCVVCIHGMCGNIADNYYAAVWGEELNQAGISLLYAHNRGHSVMNDLAVKGGGLKRYGCSYEIFEECLLDIDLALQTARDLGYRKIFLLGHSLGCNKVIYYFSEKHPELAGLILASAPDIIGSHLRGDKKHPQLLAEAEQKIAAGQPKALLSEMTEDYIYMSAETYADWFREGSNLDNLPVLRNPERWEQFATIDVPILTFSGELEEDYYQQLPLLQAKAVNCPDFTYLTIPGSNHTYRNREHETGQVIAGWVSNHLT